RSARNSRPRLPGPEMKNRTTGLAPHRAVFAPELSGRAGHVQRSRLGSRGFCSAAGAEFHLARQLPALFDHELAIADFAGNFTGRVNHQLVAHGQVAVELAADFGDVDVS